MMKKILYAIFALTCLVSCEDLLVEIPEDRISSENFYKTKADALSALYAAYAPMREPNYYSGRYMAQLEVLADYVNGRGSYAPVSAYQGFDAVNISRSEAMWEQMYSSINRANVVIDNVPAIEMNQTDKSAIVAEAYFLRALNYYNLVRNWGGVPIKTSSARDLSQIASPRSSVDNVYALIVSDLQLAERDLPSVAAQTGRATKWAAKLCLADVYLTTEKWALARDKAKEVIDSKKFDLVEVRQPNDFEKIFGAATITSTEEVFSLKFTRVNGQGLWFPTYLHRADAGYSSGGFRVVLGIPNLPIFTTWSNQDLRKEYNIYTSFVNAAGNTVKLPAAEPMLFRKFRDSESASQTAHGNDLPIFRYADAWLIFAEAASMANSGPTQAAYEAVNRIRRRAFGLPLDVEAPQVDISGLDSQTFRDAVIQERAYEFMVEGKRWLDLKRTGWARQVIEATGKKFSDNHLLWPIPRNEIDNNPAISASDQNPGY